MDINDIHIKQKYNNEGNLIVSVNNTQIPISPDKMAEAWQLCELGNYALIKPKEDWAKEIFNYILENPNDNNVMLIAILLSHNT